MSTGAASLAAEPALETPGAKPAVQGGETPAPLDPGSGAGATPATGEPWYKDLPAERHAYIENKGWKSPADAIESYTNIEKTLGLPADARAEALLVRPKADAKPEEQAAFLDKANSAFVPETADKYDLGLKPEEITPEIEQSAKWMLDAKVPQPLAQRLVAAYKADAAAAEAKFEAASLQDMKDLGDELGDKFGDFEAQGRAAFRAAKEQAGFTAEQAAAVERAIGTKGMLKLFASFGRNMGELPSPGAEARESGSGQFTQSPAQAKAKIDTLLQDSAFLARYNSPNQKMRAGAIAEMETLQIAASKGA